MSHDEVIDALEARFGLMFPAAHRVAMLDPEDPIHELCDFLVPDSKARLLRFEPVNEQLHSDAHHDPWPDFLVAIASNGCGDYFAYDLRSAGQEIVYIDPDYSVEENLTAEDKWVFGSFEDWYENRRRRQG
jgi:hypothetical protein